MSCDRDLPSLSYSLNITNSDPAYIWDSVWSPCMGVVTADFLADVRNRYLGQGAAMSIKPAIQYATVRTDRPATGDPITAGAVITDIGTYHFTETLSGASSFFFRRGLTYQLTAGSYARAEVLLHTSFRSCGKVYPPREIQYNPYNEDVEVSMFPLTGPFAATRVDKVKLAIIGMDNANNKLEYQVYARAFNDPMFRGGWTSIESDTWTTTTAGDFADNTGELPFTGLTLSNFQWMEVALGIRKNNAADANSRVILRVTPAIRYA